MSSIVKTINCSTLERMILIELCRLDQLVSDCVKHFDRKPRAMDME